MPRRCTVCKHPEREAIDQALAASGDPYRTISDRYGVSKTALLRHHGTHLPEELVKAQEAEEVARADRLLGEIIGLKGRALGILDKAEAAREYRPAVAAIREARGCIELLAKLAGELQETTSVNIVILPEWHRVRETVLEALFPYPEARAAAAEALTALPDAGPGNGPRPGTGPSGPRPRSGAGA